MNIFNGKQFQFNLKRLAYICILFFSAQAVNAQVTVDEANAVVMQYMQALTTGNISIVRSKLGKHQLIRRNSTFENKGYDKVLRKLYKNAKYEILNTEIVGADAATVDVKVTYKKNDTTEFRLWLAEEDNTLLIIEESNLMQ